MYTMYIRVYVFAYKLELWIRFDVQYAVCTE